MVLLAIQAHAEDIVKTKISCGVIGESSAQYDIETVNSKDAGYSYAILLINNQVTKIIARAQGLDDAAFLKMGAAFPVVIDGVNGVLFLTEAASIAVNGVESSLATATLDLNGQKSRSLICLVH